MTHDKGCSRSGVPTTSFSSVTNFPDCFLGLSWTCAMWKWKETRNISFGLVCRIALWVGVISARPQGQPKRREYGRTHKVVLCFRDLRRTHSTCHQKFQKLLKGLVGRARWPAGLVCSLKLSAATSKCLESILLFILGRGEIWPWISTNGKWHRSVFANWPVDPSHSISRTELHYWPQYLWKASMIPMDFSLLSCFSFCPHKAVSRRVPEMQLAFNKYLLNKWTLLSSTLQYSVTFAR